MWVRDTLICYLIECITSKTSTTTFEVLSLRNMISFWHHKQLCNVTKIYVITDDGKCYVKKLFLEQTWSHTESAWWGWLQVIWHWGHDDISALIPQPLGGSLCLQIKSCEFKSHANWSECSSHPDIEWVIRAHAPEPITGILTNALELTYRQFPY